MNKMKNKFTKKQLELMMRINELTYVQYANSDVKKELKNLRAKLKRLRTK